MTAEVVVAAIHAVNSVPRVRKIYVFTLAESNIGAILYKQPIFVQVDNVSHGIYFLSIVFKTNGRGELLPKTASDHGSQSDAGESLLG